MMPLCAASRRSQRFAAAHRLSRLALLSVVLILICVLGLRVDAGNSASSGGAAIVDDVEEMVVASDQQVRVHDTVLGGSLCSCRCSCCLN